MTHKSEEDGSKEQENVVNRFSRRDALHSVGGAAVGMSILGIDPTDREETKELILTVNERGEPDRTREVSAERYRRLHRYKNMRRDGELPEQATPHINGMTIAGKGDSIDFILYISENAPEIPTPDDIDGIPVHVERREKPEVTPDDCEDPPEPKCRYGEVSDPLEGGTHSDGATISFIGYNDDTDDPYRCIVLTHHATEGQSELHQPPEGWSGSRKVAEHDNDAPDLDAAKYKLVDGISSSPRSTIEDKQPDITGAWTFEGLADETDVRGDSVPCSMAGAQHCYEENKAIGTERWADPVNRQVYFYEAVSVGGDSGAPFIDDNGKLIAINWGRKTVHDRTFPNTCQNIGPCAWPLLNAIDVLLYNPLVP